MNKQLQDNLVSKFSEGLRPVDTRELWDWLHEYVSLPNVYHPEGTFNIDFYPYLKRPMQDLLDDNIKQINLAACTQAGKSLLQQVFVPYIILESPGPVLMIHDTQENAKRVCEERLIPLLSNIKPIKRLLDGQRFSARKSGVQLPHMTFRVSGPAESNILGYSARIILGDELWRWQADNHKDIIEKLKNRTTAYNATKKLVFASQPDFEGSEFHKECMKGQWWEYGFRCPACNELQLYEWNGETEDGKEYGIIMDKTQEDDEGIKDYDKKASSARIVCQHCFQEILDTPVNRKSLVVDGDYILIHKGHDSSIHTYSWSQFLNISIPFKQIAMTYLEAVIQKRTTGLRTKHELFRQQTLGRFWKMGQQVDLPKLMTEAYKPSDAWPDETIRFLTIDVQKDFLYWLVRSWSNKCSESRLIDWGALVNFSEIEEVIKKYNIHPLCIGVDSGYEARQVYAESVQRGKVITLQNGKRMFAQWTCFKGDGGMSALTPKKFYKHTIVEKDGKKIDIDRLYATLTLVDPQFPVGSKFKAFKANLYVWSNYSIKSILQRLRDKKLPFKWSLNERADADYTHQMFSEELSPKGRFEQIHPKNHLFDCECLQLVMALQADCFHPSPSDLNEISISPELTP